MSFPRNNHETAPPPAAGVRVRWEALPEPVRRLIEDRLERRVIEAMSQPGGFSPGLASILVMEDGRSVFVKAVGPELNPDTPAMHRREAMIAAVLPADAPVPRFLWSHDEGADGWIALAYEAVAGRQPRTPWDAGELDRVIDALVRLTSALTPSPVTPDQVGRTDDGWTIAEVNRWERLASEHPDRLDPWSRRHLDWLVSTQERARDAVRGNTLLHVDLRADNLLITGDQVMIVDWPHARIGAAWIDLAAMAPSVVMQGGPEPDDLLLRHPAAHDADPDAITTFIALLAGYFLYQAALPDPPGLLTVRAFQRAQGEITPGVAGAPARVALAAFVPLRRVVGACLGKILIDERGINHCPGPRAGGDGEGDLRHLGRDISGGVDARHRGLARLIDLDQANDGPLIDELAPQLHRQIGAGETGSSHEERRATERLA